MLRALWRPSVRRVSTFPPFPHRVPARCTRPATATNTMQPPPPLPAPVNATKPLQESPVHRVVFRVGPQDFETIVVDSPVPVVLECWAKYSPASVQLGVLVSKLVQSYAGKIRLARVDVEAHPEIAKELQIKTLPTLYTVHEGRVVNQAVGLAGEEALKQYVDKAASLNKQ
ncbi:hypothetical protein BASA81_012486 [Batrachochytrium salamandrivorans]|nr:hypothetical protein BASA81_012486 [Batrachochytrium salamandrivorans]